MRESATKQRESHSTNQQIKVANPKIKSANQTQKNPCSNNQRKECESWLSNDCGIYGHGAIGSMVHEMSLQRQNISWEYTFLPVPTVSTSHFWMLATLWEAVTLSNGLGSVALSCAEAHSFLQFPGNRQCPQCCDMVDQPAGHWEATRITLRMEVKRSFWNTENRSFWNTERSFSNTEPSPLYQVQTTLTLLGQTYKMCLDHGTTTHTSFRVCI